MFGRLWICLALLPVWLSAPAAGAQEDKPAVVAIFLMESRGSPLSADEVVGLTDYLAARLGEGGRFQIIPRDELRKRLVASKKKSYKECFDSSCQIELGRELAAQFSISSAISKVGTHCLITSSVWDLRRATQVKAAAERTACKADALIDAVDLIADKLDAAMSGKPIQRRPQPVAVAPRPTPTPAPAPAPAAGRIHSRHLGLPAAVFGESAEVPLAWSGLPGNSGDWVSVATEGMPDDTYVTYMYTGGKADGTFNLAGLDPGQYEARVYLNWPKGGYEVADRLAFQVQAAGAPVAVAPAPAPAPAAGAAAATRSEHLGLSRTHFRAGEPVEVFWYDTTGSRYDWVAVVPAGTADDDAGSNYDYLNGKKDGSYTVNDLEPGDYEARIYLDYSNLGYKVADRLAFTVR